MIGREGERRARPLTPHAASTSPLDQSAAIVLPPVRAVGERISRSAAPTAFSQPRADSHTSDRAHVRQLRIDDERMPEMCALWPPTR
jgi:hypothetical protein